MRSATIVGYDPGGNGAHGLAELLVCDGKVTRIATRTLGTTEDVVTFLGGLPSLVALGVDTLTCWSTGPSGWRPADRWLRQRYPDVQSSVVSPNGLFGSMGLNGMAVLVSARMRFPDVFITETHPKVLYWQMTGARYEYKTAPDAMNQVLADRLRIGVVPQTEHEWDAAISAWAALEGSAGRWTNDLHSRRTEANERLVAPCGTTKYSWPE